ncbi:hypothetical protein [Alkalihalobacterium elongatum]|uniref:hypothetical protein n=1 Tax=Alkalihalobacterium elongatum TaxID=2675466 RepID=UPI001C1FB522|nr:hypothetical protein [Alkalihalobacterium elongatum]
MNFTDYIRRSIHLHGIAVKEGDLPYIEHILHTIEQAQTPLKAKPDLNEEVPITIVDPELIRHD